MKVTHQILESQIIELRKILGRPRDGYSKVDGKFKPNPGYIILDHNTAYGGYRLNVLETHGESFFTGSEERLSAKEMYQYLNGILQGLSLTN